VTDDSLRVGAHFPFNLFLPRFLLGLDLSIPLKSVTSVEKARSFWAGECVTVSYSVADDTRGIVSTQHIWVRPTRSERFIGIVRERSAAARPVRAV
jgi:hypothetical protein